MTWLAVDAASASERDAVLGLQPQAAERWRKVLELSWSIADRDLLELCRLRMAQLFDCRAELGVADPETLLALAAWRTSSSYSERTRAALAYTEQFVVDQNGVAGELEDELLGHLSQRELCNFAQALNAHDGYLRVMTLLDVAPDFSGSVWRAEPRAGVPAAPDPEPGKGRDLFTALTDPEFSAARAAFGATTSLLSGVDDVTTEVCRLRNANHQACAF